MNVGAHVQVAIRKPSEWAQGAADMLNGKIGKIAEVQTHERMTQHPLKKAKCLVVFDTPAKPWSTNQTPPRAFWFDLDELVAL